MNDHDYLRLTILAAGIIPLLVLVPAALVVAGPVVALLIGLIGDGRATR